MKRLIAAIALFASIALIGTPAWAGKHAQRRGTAAEARDMVKRAIAFFDKVGARMAFNHFTYNPAPEFKKADLYIFVLRVVEGGPIVAHGAYPDRIGKTPPRRPWSTTPPRRAHGWITGSRTRSRRSSCRSPRGSSATRATSSAAGSTSPDPGGWDTPWG